MILSGAVLARQTDIATESEWTTVKRLNSEYYLLIRNGWESRVSAREDIRQAYSTRWDRVDAWRQSGGRAMAYLCDNVPVELIEAAGFLPVRLSADPDQGKDQFERHIATQGRVSGFSYTVALYEFLLSGGADFAEALILPHNRKAIEEIHARIAAVKREHPEIALPETYLLDRSYFASFEASEFHRLQIAHFRNWLEGRAGHPIDESALARAIEDAAAHRALLGEAMKLRVGDVPLLSGSDALALIVTAHTIPRAEHAELIRRLLSDPPEEQHGPRIFLAGSPFDHPALYHAVEQAGGVVVGEDHCWGMRCTERVLSSSLSPMAAIEEQFTKQAGCSISWPLARNVAACLQRAKACRADAAIFAVMDEDGTHTWTTPDEMAALNAEGLRTLHISGLEYGIGADALDQVRSFVGDLA